jgi:hypothetical protein
MYSAPWLTKSPSIPTGMAGSRGKERESLAARGPKINKEIFILD